MDTGFELILIIFYTIYIIYLRSSINETAKVLKKSDLGQITMGRMNFVYLLLIAMLPFMVVTFFLWRDYVMSIAITLLSMLGMIDIILTIERVEYSETKILIPFYVIYIILAVMTFWTWLI